MVGRQSRRSTGHLSDYKLRQASKYGMAWVGGGQDPGLNGGRQAARSRFTIRKMVGMTPQ